MTQSESAGRAVEWLEQQAADLSSIRNATSRDPSFKNWRQGTLTVIQRIWPGDHERFERFRRIPFSPTDPRVDMRAVREWYGSGCQEAQRALTEFIADVRAHGVPDVEDGAAGAAFPGEFEEGFPTVHLPTAEPRAAGAHVDVDSILPGTAPAPVGGARLVKKGLGVKARLRDLLGIAQLSARALAGFPRDSSGSGSTGSTPMPSLQIVPVGDDVETQRSVPVPPVEGVSPAAPAESASPVPSWPVPRAQAKLPASQLASPPVILPMHPPAAETVPRAAGHSVILSSPTTLHGSIDKVSIESLISDEFRNPNVQDPSSPEKAPRGAEVEPPTRPALTLVRSYDPDPGFDADAEIDEVRIPEDEVMIDEADEEWEAIPDPAADGEVLAEAAPDPSPAAPVLAVTSRRAPPESEDPGFEDADAIAVSSMVHDLARLGVPPERQAEIRARLMDLGRRFERGELEWNVLRKAVWFAMEYPEIARRLMPVLLPWIDRAA